MKFKLKYKIGAVILGITLLLLSAVYIYFYITGIDQIENNAESKLDFFHSSIQNEIDKKLSDVSIEINSLKNQLEVFDFSITDLFYDANVDLLISQFLLGYSDYYTFLDISDPDRNISKEYRLLKVFTGEYKVISEISEFDYSDSKGQEGESGNFYNPMLITTAKEKVIIATEKLDGSGIFLTAKLKFDLISNIFTEDSYLPEDIKFFLFDSTGIIHSSNNLSKINSIITHYFKVYDQNSGENEIFKENYWKTEYAKYKTSPLKSSKLILLSEINIVNSVDKLHSIATNALLFSLFLIIVVALIVNIFANRISNSLNKITKVASNVASGKFNEKLEIKRNDELGDLIDSFNKMTENLDRSYSEMKKLNFELNKNYDELKKTRAALCEKEKLALIGETTSKISHEIQNKISAVSIWVQNLEIQIVNDDLSKVYLKEIKSSLENFLQMLINFKRFYRQPKIIKENFKLIEFIYQLECNYRNLFESKNISLVIISERNDLELFAEKSLVEEVLVNLLMNAVEHSLENSKITLEIAERDGEIIIIITDNGTGVKEENIEHLFQPFFSTKSSGSGLGLAIAKNIINAHNGSIELDENYTRGARFILKFPMKTVKDHENSIG